MCFLAIAKEKKYSISEATDQISAIKILFKLLSAEN
jgi:hypothetical protein